MLVVFAVDNTFKTKFALLSTTRISFDSGCDYLVLGDNERKQMLLMFMCYFKNFIKRLLTTPTETWLK